MFRIVLGRLLGSLGAIVGASFVSFIFLRIAPGDPTRAILGQFASDDAVRQLSKDIGLDQPVYVQYERYMWDFLRGDWGFSYDTGQPVATQLAHRLPATVELGFYAFAFAFVGAVVLALLATYRHRPAVDQTVRGVASIGLGTPPFWFGLVLLIIFSEKLHLLPGPDGRLTVGVEAPPSVTGFYTFDALIAGQFGTFADAAAHLVLPVLTLAFAPFAFLVRLLRANLLDVSGEPFLVVVRSKGIGRWKAFLRHALPNAFLPTLAASGITLGQLLAGSVVVEKVFNWPGVGLLVTDAVLRQDYAVVQGVILLAAFVYVLVNFVVDILSALIDPRIRRASAVSG
jgi:ABC-type dipeptide/oligopeptide/nickel transport system permease component